MDRGEWSWVASEASRAGLPGPRGGFWELLLQHRAWPHRACPHRSLLGPTEEQGSQPARETKRAVQSRQASRGVESPAPSVFRPARSVPAPQPGAGERVGECGPRRRPASGLPSVPAQTRATTAAPAPTASTRLSAVACPASRGPSVRRTSTSAPATRAATGPTAQTAWTATPAPAPPASAASTARTTLPTAQRGECHGRPGPRAEAAGRRAGGRVRCPVHPAGVPWASPHCPSSQTGSPGSSEGQRENPEAWQFLRKS